jgi:hypothetical protein
MWWLGAVNHKALRTRLASFYAHGDCVTALVIHSVVLINSGSQVWQVYGSAKLTRGQHENCALYLLVVNGKCVAWLKRTRKTLRGRPFGPSGHAVTTVSVRVVAIQHDTSDNL